ncbi:MAG: TonB-dependent receptor domain-containing protein [Pyrinomonadaceae bacterium]
MSKSLKMSLAVLVLICLSGVALAQSQASTGQISGIITDTNGAVVPNVTVKAKNKGTGLERTVNSSDAGLYTIVLLPPGTYTLTAEVSGFAPTTVDDVIVNVGRTADANVTMGASGVQATVLVTAEAIQVTRNESDAVVNETAIRTLPINGRRFQDFVTLTPTAQVDPSRGQISLAGQKGINGNVTIDGADYNQPFFGGIRGGERSNLAFTVPQEAIKEFQVVASGYSAEFGRSTGGIVNAVTRSGDNSVRGSAFWLYRPSRLAKGNEFTQALADQKLTALGVNPTLAATQHQFGGSIGGPIKKDRLFYFGAYEQQRFRAPRQIVFSIPTAFPPSFISLSSAQQSVLSFFSGEQVSYIQTNDAYAGLARVDWNVNNSHTFNVRFSGSRNNALNAASRGETAIDPTTNSALSSNGTEQNTTRILVAQLVDNFGPTIVNEMRFQYARETRPRLSNSEVPNFVTSFGSFGAAGSSTSSFLPNEEHDTRYQITDAITVIKGNHNFKFGGEYSHIDAAQTFGFNQFGRFNMSIGAACISATNCTAADTLLRLSSVPIAAGSLPAYTSNSNAFLGRFDSTSATYNVQIGNRIAALSEQQLAFFGQDSWRITPRFTLNYGLRGEAQYNPTPDTSNTTIVNIVKNTVFPFRGKSYDPSTIPDSGWEWGPRVGFAWDPEGQGKTVIRGYGGVYYATTPLLLLAAPINNFRTPPGDVSVQLPFSVGAVNQTAFNSFLGTAAGAQYIAITGCNPVAASGSDARNRCTPNTIFRQFAILGINLNSSALSSLPQLSPTQVSSIASAIGFTPNAFNGAQVIGAAEDFKNPRATQFGAAVEREVAKGLVVGVNFDYVHTTRNQRNVELNLPAPLTGDQYITFLTASNTAANVATMSAPGGIFDQIRASGRSYIAVVTPGGFTNPTTGASLSFPGGSVTTRQRPTLAQQGFNLGSVQVRSSIGKALYRALTFRARWTNKRLQLNTYYTFSRLLSDDDNERDAGGVSYDNPYNLAGEYYASRLNRESQFMANPILFLPWDFEVSAALRLRSGLPFNPAVGADLNGDTVNNDRPLLVPGVEYKRNYFVNRGIYDADLRVQKSFRFGERQRLIFSSEFFNILNRPNLLVGTSAAPGTNTTFGSGGNFCVSSSQLCGLNSGPGQNPVFLQVRDRNTGSILINNVNPGSQVFQMQLGVRFQF